MEVFEVITNQCCSDFDGDRRFFSDYGKVRDFVFNHRDCKFYFRQTDIEESPETFEGRLGYSGYETIRMEDNRGDNDLLSLFPNMEHKPIYHHVLKVNVC